MYRIAMGYSLPQGALGSMSRVSSAVKLGPPPLPRRDVSRRSKLGDPRSTRQQACGCISPGDKLQGREADGPLTAGTHNNTHYLPVPPGPCLRYSPSCMRSGTCDHACFSRACIGRRGWVALPRLPVKKSSTAAFAAPVSGAIAAAALRCCCLAPVSRGP